MIQKSWKMSEADEALQNEISERLSISRTLSGILIRRGFRDAASAAEFFFDDEKPLHDPYLMKDMECTVKRIAQAVTEGEKITVYGDYDVDGISSTALMLKTLALCGAEADFYIPEREKEGYGINVEALTSIAENGSKLLITVDCGISALNEINDFHGEMDIIITDHHMPPDVLPRAFAILNPKQEGCAYPEKSLAGVGVAYKLCQALCGTFNVPEPVDGLEIAALGTVADIVPLLGENRLIVKRGLINLNKSRNVGLKALLQECGLVDKKIDSGHVGFMIAPRLNAAGRLGTAKTAAALLLTDDEARARLLAQELNTENERRQLIEKDILRRAEECIARFSYAEDNVLVVDGEEWNPGVIGIVASRVVERYYRPTIILTKEEGIARGSCRSIPGFNIYEALKKCEDLLIGYGGHSLAAGLSILPERIPSLRERLNQIAEEVLTEEDYIPVVEIDATVKIADIREEMIVELSRLEPYGMGNRRPLFALMNVDLAEAKAMGREGAHLRFKVGERGGCLNGIAWNKGALVEEMNAYGKIDIAFQPEINEWQGNRSIQIKAQEIRCHVREMTEIDRLFMAAAEENPYRDIGSAEQFYTKIVGVSFGNRQTVIAGLNMGDRLQLVREADNAYDANAISVQTIDGQSLGFLRAQIAAELAPLIDLNETRYKVRVTDITGSAEQNFGVNLWVGKEGEKSCLRRKATAVSQEEVGRRLLGERTYHAAQLDALALLAEGKNTLVVMGTGRGKSAIFQTYAALAAINRKKMTVIVYPLRALVNDQFLNLQSLFAPLGIAVHKGNGTLNTGDRGALFEAMANKEVDVLLTTPEFLEANLDACGIDAGEVGLFVVDECHHIAQDSRRAAYKNIAKLIGRLGNPLTLGVTATADTAAAEAIKKALAVDAMVVDKTVRENLSVRDGRGCRDKFAYICGIVARGEKVLVFVNSRKKAVEIAAALREAQPDMAEKIGFYHAGLSNEWRVKVETWFKNGKLQVVVATSAFGEGIDLPDIRHVVQYHLPFDMTSFNQQCGRAGRDGKSSLIHLLFGQDDIKFNRLILQERAPERELLGKIYLTLKNNRDAEGKLVKTNNEIAASCMEKYKLFVGEAGVSSCLRILEELTLISRETFAGTRTIFFHETSRGKMDLSQSSAYVEGLYEREAFEKFSTEVLQLPKETLLFFINKPIYPQE